MPDFSETEEELRDWIRKGKMIQAKYLLILSKENERLAHYAQDDFQRNRVVDYYSKFSFKIQQFDLH
jgi:hypothetical protein